MSKKSAKQKRKEGWQEAKQGINDFVDVGKNDTTTASVGSKGVEVRKTQKGSLPYRAKEKIKAIAKIVKGVTKGIFNSPDWWKYQGTLSIPAYNANRPYDPNNTNSLLGEGKIEPNVGVGHIIKVNTKYNDSFIQSDEFILAANEAFKNIRLVLRSNLPYDFTEYCNYLRVVLALMVKCKSVERLLGWYTITRADIPELHDAITSVAGNINEMGRINPSIISMIDGDNYAKTLNLYKQLQATCRLINIPKKFAEFISWIFGSTFTDQRAVNPQIYINELRSCPVYTGSTPSRAESIMDWDISTGSIQDLIDEAISIISNFGLINADAEKIPDMYGKIELMNVNYGEYKEEYLIDDEYFSILINNYTLDRNSGKMKSLMNPEYVRVDVFESLKESNLVGVVNALGQWAGKTLPVTFVSQSLYLTHTPGNNLRSSGTFQFNSKSISMLSSAYTGKGYFIQFNSDVNFSDVYSLNDTESPDIVVTSNNKLRFSVQASKLVFNVNNKFYANYSSTDLEFDITLLSFSPFEIPAEYDGQRSVAIHATKSAFGGPITAAELDLIQYDRSGNVKSRTKLGDLTITNDTEPLTWTFNASGNVVVTEANAIAAILPLLFINVSLWYDSAVNGQLGLTSVVLTPSTAKAQATIANDMLLQQFIQLVDMHFPLVVSKNVTINTSSDKFTIQYGGQNLIKEVYVPLTFNYDDVGYVMYWMYLGLFSISKGV